MAANTNTTTAANTAVQPTQALPANVSKLVKGQPFCTLKVALQVMQACGVTLQQQYVRGLGKAGTIATKQITPEYTDTTITVYNVNSIVQYCTARNAGQVRTQTNTPGTLYTVRLTTEQFNALPANVQQLLKPSTQATPEAKAKRQAYNKARQLKLKAAKQAANAAQAELERKAAQAANTPA
jgi:hypothetical protein